MSLQAKKGIFTLIDQKKNDYQSIPGM